MPSITNTMENLKRVEVNYTNNSKKFISKELNFSNQYFHIYAKRITEMKDKLLHRIQLKWGQKYNVCRLGDVPSQKGFCIVIGTIFKDQQLKPSVLKDISEENQLLPQPQRTHFADDSDFAILEDELQRIRLCGDIDVHGLVTGIPCAILGEELELGKFEVKECIFVDCAEQIERPILEHDILVVLVSGIDLASSSTSNTSLFEFELFIDWVTGLVGNNKTQKDVCNVERVIIAGNSVKATANSKEKQSLISRVDEKREDVFEAVNLLDKLLVQLCHSVNVDLMPGEFDPANHMLPQQPLHFCLVQNASNLKTFNSVLNPYECEIDNVQILGTSGQPIHDILRYSKIESPLEALERCIEWGHFCPTAPDTLPCYPFYDRDPFILSKCPHVVFAGNQPEFETKIYTGPEQQRVRLICIPEFNKTKTIAILNLKTFDCFPMSFKVK